MPMTDDQLAAILTAPREALDIELKRWLDPKSDEGKGKIAKGCMALWNSGGGLFIVGFDDKTGEPDIENAVADPQAVFHPDRIQAIVSEFAAPPFPVTVHFGRRDDQLYPVIEVSSGVRVPAAAKRDFFLGNKPVIKDHAVYVRSLGSNNTVSSSEPRRDDWERVVRTWLENREADIGAFVRRHLSGIDLASLGALLGGPRPVLPPTALDRAVVLLDQGRGRFDAVVKERGLPPPHLGWREAAIVVDGLVPPNSPDEAFLQRLTVTKPRHSGWSPWVVAPAAGEDQYVNDGGWESIIWHPEHEWLPGLDFWRLDPQGEFYQLEALQDDFHEVRGVPRGTQLDFHLQVERVVEFVTAARSFARSMGCPEAGTSLACAFRWRGLKGRRLVSRRHPGSVRLRPAAVQDELVSTLTVPLEVPPSALGPHVHEVLRPLFTLFGGAEFEATVIENLVRDIVAKRY